VLSAAGLALHRTRPYGLRGLRRRLLGGLVSHALRSLGLVGERDDPKDDLDHEHHRGKTKRGL
jgi:hypothetical protein